MSERTLTDQERAEWEAWVASRPEVVRDLATRLPPFRDYWLTTGQRAAIRSYCEDGTLTAEVWSEFVPFPHGVFGLKPEDFVTERPANAY